MNNINENKSFNSGYTDVFTCMGFNEAEVCVHTFNEHSLLYVYSGHKEVNDGNVTESVELGRCAFIHKGENPEPAPMKWCKINLEKAILCN